MLSIACRPATFQFDTEVCTNIHIVELSKIKKYSQTISNEIEEEKQKQQKKNKKKKQFQKLLFN